MPTLTATPSDADTAERAEIVEVPLTLPPYRLTAFRAFLPSAPSSGRDSQTGKPAGRPNPKNRRAAAPRSAQRSQRSHSPYRSTALPPYRLSPYSAIERLYAPISCCS